MSTLAFFNYSDNVISRRNTDGFINLTQMCQANDKRLDIFIKSKSTQDYIKVLENYHQMVVIDSKRGNAADSGTWGHPSLAINLARWISPEFSVWCDAHIFNLMSTGQTAIASQTKSIILANQQIALLSEQNELLKTQCKEFKATANLIVGQVVEITTSKIEALKLRVEGCDRTIGNIQFQLTNQAHDFKVLLTNNQHQQETVNNTFNLLNEIQNKIASQGDINQFIPEKSAEAYREKAEQIDQENRLKFKKIREINEIKKWEKN